MTTGGKVVLGLGAAAVVGGGLYVLYRRQQAAVMLANTPQPAEVGVTSIYDPGVPVGGGGMSAMIGGAAATLARIASGELQPLTYGPPAAPPPPVVAVSEGPAIETRRGVGHF